jgi:hypothetical protein
MWFNVYLIDRKSLSPEVKSKIVYFELLNNENRPVIQKRFLSEAGIAKGQLHLPDSLSTGVYTIRAYTSWMKNFLPSNCFMKRVTIFNALSDRNSKPLIASDFRADASEPLRTMGIDLKVNNTDSSSVIISVSTDEAYRSINESFCLFIQTRGNIDHVSNERVTGAFTRVLIPKQELREGINQITLFSSKGEPLIEKFIYTTVHKNNIPELNTPDSCGTRERINMGFGPLLSGTGSLSVSVTPAASNNYRQDIASYMIFGSEFGQDHLSDKNELTTSAESRILENIHSSWIKWHEILSDREPVFKYKHEEKDHFLTGRLVTNKLEPVKTPAFIFLCTPGKEAGFQYAKTDSNGNFSFKIHIDENPKDLVIMQEELRTDRKILIESSFSDRYPVPVQGADSVYNGAQAGTSKLSINNQVQKIFGASYEGAPVRSVNQQAPHRFYGKPDIEIYLADYIKLPVMIEVFNELLPSVTLRRRKSGDEISITYRIGDYQFTVNPVLMIDGVIVRDPSLISGLDPELVEKIDVIRDNYMVGGYVFTGILNVITIAGDFSNISLPDYMIRMEYRVIEPVPSFVSPEYDQSELKSVRIPDYRNTIYWNPSAENSTQGVPHFWTSDNPGKYVINVQGIATNGRLISFRKILKVK